MVRPRVARGFVNLADAVLHQCIRPLIGACCAPGHHGPQRANHLVAVRDVETMRSVEGVSFSYREARVPASTVLRHGAFASSRPVEKWERVSHVQMDQPEIPNIGVVERLVGLLILPSEPMSLRRGVQQYERCIPSHLADRLFGHCRYHVPFPENAKSVPNIPSIIRSSGTAFSASYCSTSLWQLA
jgi:hypothetical protein